MYDPSFKELGTKFEHFHLEVSSSEKGSFNSGKTKLNSIFFRW